MKAKLTLLLALVSINSVHAGVLPNDATVDGKTISDWSAASWQWLLTIPTNQNPAFDPDGSRANAAQPDGSVFFLSSVFQISGTARRTFTVPEGKYLFAPLITTFFDNVDVGPSLFTVEELRDQTAAGIDLVNELHASIDGVPVPNLFSHRAASPVFSIDFASTDNLYTYLLGRPFSGLDDPMVADGFYLMIEPLPPGTHVINFGASVGPPVNFMKDITHTIIVVSTKHPPLADAGATALRVVAAKNGNAKVVLDGTRSSDPDNDPLTYAWLEGASVLSTAPISTNVLSVGEHLISLVVSDGKLSATNTITINVIMAEEAVRELALTVANAGLPRKLTHPLLDPLEDAAEAFHRERFEKGVHELKEFQEEVRKHLARANPAIAQVFSQSARAIIEAITQPPPVLGVLSNDALLGDKTIGEWQVECWKWIYSLPPNENPQFDCGEGRRATNGQPFEAVFFIAPVPGNLPGPCIRTFTVTEESFILAPLLAVTLDNIDIVPPLTLGEMHDLLNSVLDVPADLQATIDGISVPDLLHDRVTSPPFNFIFPDGNNILSLFYPHPIIGLDDPIIADGYWLMLEPLPIGTHVLHTGGQLSQPIVFPHDIICNITVVPIPLAERVQKLITTVKTSSLSPRLQGTLLEELTEAGSDFERNHLRNAIEQLRDFQKKVRLEVVGIDPALADRLIQAARTIIDKAKAQTQ